MYIDPHTLSSALFVHRSALRFASKVLGTEHTDDAFHYAEWLTRLVVERGQLASFDPQHEKDMKRWAAQGHGPEWFQYF